MPEVTVHNDNVFGVSKATSPWFVVTCFRFRSVLESQYIQLLCDLDLRPLTFKVVSDSELHIYRTRGISLVYIYLLSDGKSL